MVIQLKNTPELSKQNSEILRKKIPMSRDKWPLCGLHNDNKNPSAHQHLQKINIFPNI